uniref:Uncharacterized protein n=1 Tax=Glossina austeni TaxID=7395 RepID=A0A1A9UKP0_GLOAU
MYENDGPPPLPQKLVENNLGSGTLQRCVIASTDKLVKGCTNCLRLISTSKPYLFRKPALVIGLETFAIKNIKGNVSQNLADFKFTTRGWKRLLDWPVQELSVHNFTRNSPSDEEENMPTLDTIQQ